MKLLFRSRRPRVGWMTFLSGCRQFIFCVLKLVAWVPVVFVTVLLMWGYYVYVYVINLSGSFPGISKSPALSVFMMVFFLVFAHIIFCLQVTSYIRTIFTRHKLIPQQFFLTDDQLEELDQAVDEQVILQELVSDLPVNQLSRGGGVRYCDSCELIKPDRAHHCSVCNRCILKMDHHCPWVNNCVGFSNYKFFVLFLFYSVVLCLWLCVTGLNAFIIAWGTDNELKPAHKFQVIIWYFVCSMFGLSASVLFCFHVYLALFNKTTLENMQPPCIAGSNSHRPYFLTFRRNLQQVFGKNCFIAILPIFSSEGDGIVYPMMKNDVSQGDELAAETEPLAQTHL